MSLLRRLARLERATQVGRPQVLPVIIVRLTGEGQGNLIECDGVIYRANPGEPEPEFIARVQDSIAATWQDFRRGMVLLVSQESPSGED